MRGIIFFIIKKRSPYLPAHLPCAANCYWFAEKQTKVQPIGKSNYPQIAPYVYEFAQLVRRGFGGKKLQNFGHMSKSGLPYVPCTTLIWTKKVWTSTLLSTRLTYPKSLDILESKFVLLQFFLILKPSVT